MDSTFKPAMGALLTVIETVAHRRPDRDPVTCEAGFTLPLKSGKQARIEELSLNEVWVRLPTDGHIFLVVKHIVRRAAINEKSKVEAVVELGVESGGCFTAFNEAEAGRFCSVKIVDRAVYGARARGGACQADAYLFPG